MDIVSAEQLPQTVIGLVGLVAVMSFMFMGFVISKLSGVLLGLKESIDKVGNTVGNSVDNVRESVATGFVRMEGNMNSFKDVMLVALKVKEPISQS